LHHNPSHEPTRRRRRADGVARDAASASEQARALHRCLGELEGRQRELISLAYLRDLSHGELAEQLALPLGTVKTWIRRSLEKLRNCMRQFV